MCRCIPDTAICAGAAVRPLPVEQSHTRRIDADSTRKNVGGLTPGLFGAADESFCSSRGLFELTLCNHGEDTHCLALPVLSMSAILSLHQRIPVMSYRYAGMYITYSDFHLQQNEISIKERTRFTTQTYRYRYDQGEWQKDCRHMHSAIGYGDTHRKHILIRSSGPSRSRSLTCFWD